MKHVRNQTCVVSTLLAAALLIARPVLGEDIVVRDSKGLRAAIHAAKPGTTITLMPGQYRGGISLAGIRGRADAPITVGGAHAKKLPVFSGGTEALHLSDCSYVVLRNIRVRGYVGNGINADDGGTYETPAHHLRFENLTIEKIGPLGNHDALKLSGVDDFVVSNCTFRGWGGSAIDMVGCHNGVIENCRFIGMKGFSQHSGVQMKGGTTNILVRRSYFKNAGSRAINLGGCTDLKYFRPSVPDYEARDIVVAGNWFIGSEAPVAWVTASGGRFHHNTLVFPGRWVLRILQETKDVKFRPCHGGSFENNLIVYKRRLRTFANVGPGTDPRSFMFRSNAWFQVDGSAKPVLPMPETEGVYQVDPKLKTGGPESMRVTSKDPRLADIGADSYKQ